MSKKDIVGKRHCCSKTFLLKRYFDVKRPCCVETLFERDLVREKPSKRENLSEREGLSEIHLVVEKPYCRDTLLQRNLNERYLVVEKPCWKEILL